MKQSFADIELLPALGVRRFMWIARKDMELEPHDATTL